MESALSAFTRHPHGLSGPMDGSGTGTVPRMRKRTTASQVDRIKATARRSRTYRTMRKTRATGRGLAGLGFVGADPAEDDVDDEDEDEPDRLGQESAKRKQANAKISIG